jgi:hypothetical protein
LGKAGSSYSYGKVVWSLGKIVYVAYWWARTVFFEGGCRGGLGWGGRLRILIRLRLVTMLIRIFVGWGGVDVFCGINCWSRSEFRMNFFGWSER